MILYNAICSIFIKKFCFSPKVPLFELTGHEEKVMCSDWSNQKLILSGGADNTVRIFKNKNIKTV
jgi:WD40 repeat protein